MEGAFAIGEAALRKLDRQSQVNLLSKRTSGEKKQYEADRVNKRLERKVAL
jgi:hypothetical protein